LASYHSSFTYLNKSTINEGLIIASFEPDSGFVDSFLGMDQVISDSYNGVKKFFYGNKYNTTATISITLVKADGSDFSLADNREVLRWLTGTPQASWIDLYEGKKFVYSFYGSVTSVQQQKLDARVIGIQFTFSSIYPWAYSAPQYFDCYVGNEMLAIDDSGIIYKEGENPDDLGIDKNGVLYNDDKNEFVAFGETVTHAAYSDPAVTLRINNQSDDLYSYINLNLVYKNETGKSISIKNITLDEETLIREIDQNETVTLSSGQFIISSKDGKIFGDTFNFIWPRLCPGENTLVVNTIDGNGKGSFNFSYRYPIKVGDCATDTENLVGNPILCGF